MKKDGQSDVVLIGAGIMSATLGAMLKELAPEWNITIFEKLSEAGAESTNEWNNAGTGHNALCELNYTVEKKDGRTYYSFDDGGSFEPLTEEEFEQRFPTPDVEWWTYEEYAAWLEKEKKELQGMIGERGWTGGRGEFVWTQEIVDETIAVYEEILQDIKNGLQVSRSVNGNDDIQLAYNPEDVELGASERELELSILLSNGEQKMFGPYETEEELLAEVEPFCEEQVRLGNMEQSEADEIIGRYVK